MRSRGDVDPELHVLRTVAQSCEGRTQHQMETARFNLYNAFEQGDRDSARRWARSLRAALLALQETGHQLVPMGLEALGEIEKGIDE